jgi:hypothetical protein
MQLTPVADARHQRLRHFIRRERRRRRSRGARLLAVVAVPLILVGSCLELRGSRICLSSSEMRDRSLALEMAKCVSRFADDAGRLPLSVDELAHPPPPLRPFIERVPRDSWGRPFRIVAPALRSGLDFDVVSAGPDGVFFTGDDIGNWESDGLLDCDPLA